MTSVIADSKVFSSSYRVYFDLVKLRRVYSDQAKPSRRELEAWNYTQRKTLYRGS